MNIRTFSVVALLIVLFTMVGCGGPPQDNQEVTLLPTTVFEECERYAVVTAAHLLLYSQPTHSADVVHIARRQDTLTILDANIDQQQYYARQGKWYFLNADGIRGWGFGTFMTTHCHKYQAELQTELLQDSE